MHTNEGNLMRDDEETGRDSNNSKKPPLSLSHSENSRVLPDNSSSVQQPAKNLVDLSNAIFAREKSGFKRIEFKDIYMVKGQRDYINIYTKKKRYVIHATLYSMLEKLPKADFIRVHRSFIVRIDSISVIHNTVITVEDKQITIGKLYKEDLLSKLNLIG